MNPNTHFSLTNPFNTGIGDDWLDNRNGWRSLLSGVNAADASLGADYVQRLRDLAGYTTTGEDGQQYFIRGDYAPTSAYGEQGGAGGGGVGSVYDLLGKSGTVTPGEQIWGVSRYNPEADDITDYNGYVNDGFDSEGNFLSSGTMAQTGDKGFMKNMLTNLLMVGGAGLAGYLGVGSQLGGAGSGSFLGEGAASGIGAWDGALASSPSWTSAGGFAGGAAGGIGDVGGSGAFLGEGVSSGIPAWDAAGSSGISKILGGMGASDWLRLGGGLLGALGGSQGQQTTTTTNRELPPYLAERVPGLLGEVDALRNFQLYGTRFGNRRRQEQR